MCTSATVFHPVHACTGIIIGVVVFVTLLAVGVIKDFHGLGKLKNF